MSQSKKAHSTTDLFAFGGEMGERMRSFDWTSNALGSPDTWPQSLKTALRIMLTSRQPFWLGWGEELVFFYNDAYKPIMGNKHVEALGQPVQKVWWEIWDDISPLLATATKGNEGTYVESQLLIMERNGYPEETYYTFSYSPIPSDGGVGGIICANTDNTEQVIGERQLVLLRELATKAVDAREVSQACLLCAEALATNPFDFPFAMIYLAEPDGQHMSLAGFCGIESEHPAAPKYVKVDNPSLPFASVLGKQSSHLFALAEELKAHLPMGAWQRCPSQAALIPISATGETGRSGVLVVGLNPFRLFDDKYKRFLELTAGQIASSIAYAQAYSEERKRAEALAELDRAKTTFFSNVSHEFRTPLTLLLGPIEDALNDAQIDSESRIRLDMAHRNALRLLKLVNTLLDFSRIEEGRAQASYVATDLALFTRELASSFGSAMEKAGLNYKVNCVPLSEPAYVDPDMWEKIVFNLLSNAFKYTLAGQIELLLNEDNGHAVLCVRDTGIGIPIVDLPHIFERFHRVEGAQGRAHEGSGIGLALVRELVKLHGGMVSVDSEEGAGSSFTIRIPLGKYHIPEANIKNTCALSSTAIKAEAFVEEALRWIPEDPTKETLSAPKSEMEVNDAKTSGAHILLVDDNADMRNYVERLLAVDYRVEAVTDGEAALVAIEKELPDLVLTDVMMPKLDGFGLLTRLRADERTKDLPVIMLSARAGEEARIEGVEAGADDYLVKPFSVRELMARVSSVINLARVRNEARKRADEANRSKTEFLANMSHEIRTPMNAVIGLSDILSKDKELSSKQREMVNTIQLSAQSLLELLNDLLDFTKLETNQLRLERIPFKLNSVINEVFSLLSVKAREKNIRLDHLCSLIGEHTFLGDPLRIRQVLTNLVSNAIKFTETGGVTISLATSAHEKPNFLDAHIKVSDTGIGIAPEQLTYIFDKFTQGDASITRKYGGTGLGLAISKNLAEIMGGSIAVRSNIGQGAEFTLHLPLELADASEPSLPLSEKSQDEELEPGRIKGCILLVEDLKLNAVIAGHMVEALGYSYDTASNGREALTKIRANRDKYIAVLMDVQMPDIDGLEATRAIRLEEETLRLPRLRIIAMTAHALQGDMERCIAAGMDEYVSKPFQLDDLQNKLRAL